LPAVFIFGLFPDFSGKTVVATALARGLLNEGLDVGVFKPRSGHNMWYQYEAFLKCKSNGRLFCEDIIKLKEASECPLPYEVLNPVDALLTPFNIETFLERNLISRMFLIEPDTYQHLTVERYTILENEKKKNLLLLNKRSVETNLVMLDRDYLKKLENTADQVIPLHNLNEWIRLSKEFGPKAIYSCYQKVRRACKNLVIEGFNDAVSPEPKILDDVDVVIGVAPGTAIFYNPEEFKELLNALMKLGKDLRALRAEDVIKFIREYKIFKIPPLPRECLKDYDKLSEKLKDIVNYVKSSENKEGI